MKKLIGVLLTGLFMLGCIGTNANKEEIMEENKSENPIVLMETSMGTIEIELDAKNAPITVENFLKYLDSGYYNGTVFHRVIDNFMIQGGGFTTEGKQKETNQSIVLESHNGLLNNIGTIAMARTAEPNSATSQFFINVKNNDSLNWSPRNPGYAVFGKVVSGMDIVNKIKSVQTGTKNRMPNWPNDNVVMEKVVLK